MDSSKNTEFRVLSISRILTKKIEMYYLLVIVRNTSSFDVLVFFCSMKPAQTYLSILRFVLFHALKVERNGTEKSKMNTIINAINQKISSNKFMAFSKSKRNCSRHVDTPTTSQAAKKLLSRQPTFMWYFACSCSHLKKPSSIIIRDAWMFYSLPIGTG